MRKYSKIFAVVMSCVLVSASTVPVYADDKTDSENATGASYSKYENVYAKLEADGTASDAYVVNHFSVNESGDIVDYGNYDEIKNLTSLDSITKKDDCVEFQAEKGEFYYQGEMKDVCLPWNFTITYELDGKKIASDELAGRDGRLKVIFKSEKNEAADENFYDNYLMQISLTLDCTKARNIVAEGAAMADAGADRQLSFTVLPGSDADFVIEADVNDFTMSGFSIAAVPYSMSIDMDEFNIDDFTGQISELTDAVGSLSDGADGIKDGLEQLCSGNGELLNGSTQLQNGLSTLNNNSSSITDASAQIKASLNAISYQLGSVDFNALGLAPEVAGQMSALVNGLSTLAAQYGEFDSGLSAYVYGVDSISENYEAFQNGITSYLAGTEALRDGAYELAGGMAQFADGISEMPSDIENTIDEMVGSMAGDAYSVASFTDSKNVQTESVQFVISTKGIDAPKKAEPVEAEQKAGFWSRLKALFTK